MAFETFIGKDGADIEIEAYRLRQSRLGAALRAPVMMETGRTKENGSGNQ